MRLPRASSLNSSIDTEAMSMLADNLSITQTRARNRYDGMYSYGQRDNGAGGSMSAIIEDGKLPGVEKLRL